MERKRQGSLMPMEKFREMMRLHEMGFSQSDIAQSCLVGRSTVQDYLKRAAAKGLSFEHIQELSDSEVRELLGKGR